MSKVRWRVLIFPGGTENGLEIRRSLQWCKEVELFSVSSDVPNQAPYAYVNNFIIPDVRETGWLAELNKVIKDNTIDIIIPANSVIIDYLNKNRKDISCDILLPDYDVVEITRSKKSTLQILDGLIPLPKEFKINDEIEQSDFPVFVKPDRGYGAQGTYLVENKQEAERINREINIVEEFLPGREYTVDCFSDGREILFAGGRERIRIRMGTSMHCEDISKCQQEEFERYAKLILRRIPIRGYWFFQMKEDKNGQLKLLEIDIRIAGTMAFHRCKGVNFPLLALYQFYGFPIDIHTNGNIKLSMDRCLRNSYTIDYNYKVVYVDLDDTIIVHGKINTQIICFLYKCINKKIKIILLSKNEDKSSLLKEMKIYQIFDEIIWIKESDSKFRYIKEKKAIFIDDSFSQRIEVQERCGIPTFDSSMIDCLMDERS